MSYYSEQDYDDEEVPPFGTPFAPLEDQEIVQKRPEIDLTVRDSRGRRRFHGAFTGGFSAGFWNTVGSEEGFTPQQYVSKRDDKWDQSLVHRKPEDFMDSEDMDVFGIAPKRIRTKEKFVEQEFAGFRETNASLIDVLKSVIKPSVESIGLKLFKQMKRNARNEVNYNSESSKVYGCEKPSNKTSFNNNLPFCIYEPKSDFHGIGYKGIESQNNLLTDSTMTSSEAVSAVLSGGRKINISGEAFGYGVLEEDNEEDDAVVYHKDDMSQYDFAIGSLTKKIDKKSGQRLKAIDVLKSDIIDGFVKCLTKTNLMDIISKKYPIPVLPRDWRPSSLSSVVSKPKSKSRWDQTNSESHSLNNITANNSSSTSAAQPKPPVLNANMRAILLGQEVIHRHGVKHAENEQQSESSVINVSLDEKKEKTSLQSIAQKPLTGFWANKFTRSNAVEECSLSGGLTDFNIEKSVDMKKQENETNVAIERTVYEWHPHNLLCKRFNIPNPYPQYPDVVGIVTVGKTDVRNRTSHMTAKKSKPNIFECLFQEQNHHKSTVDPNYANASVSSETTDANKSETNSNPINVIQDNSDEKVRPPMDLFKAIFASDEEESDDESATNDDNIGSNKTNEDKSVRLSDDSDRVVINSNNSSNRMSGPKATGIFANIDFDQLNRNFTPIIKTHETQDIQTNERTLNEKAFSETNLEKTTESEQNDDFYGPALPPTISSFSTNLSNVYTNMNNNSSETKTKSSKRKKKEKKHKKHRKQSSVNKKHKRHRRSSSSSSSDADIDIKILQYVKNARK